METNRPTNQERLNAITDSIEKGIRELFESEKYQRYLSVMSRFHQYSVNNTMLIYMQKPNATLVAGFNRWKNKFQRHVKRGEHGITIIAPCPCKKKTEVTKKDPITGKPILDSKGKPILEEKEITVPMFRPTVVFDVSQTEGRELPRIIEPLTGDVQDYENLMEALRRASPVPITFEALPDQVDGYFNRTEQCIGIRTGMSEIQTIAAAVHEIAHSKLHNYKGNGDPQEEKNYKTQEVEAESVSFAVCQYYGIETRANSFGYIAGWSEDKNLSELRASLTIINRTAGELIGDIDRHYRELMEERAEMQEEHAAIQEEQDLIVRQSLEEKEEDEFTQQLVSMVGAAAGVKDLERRKKRWDCYIIPDLSTWSTDAADGGTSTPIEFFETYEEAVARFRVLRKLDYNNEKKQTEKGRPCPRLTFGIQREDPPEALDLLRVQNGKNYLVDEFAYRKREDQNPKIHFMLRQIQEDLGFDRVEFRSAGDEPPMDVPFSQWENHYFEAMPDHPLYLVDEKYYLHLQACDEGWDYTLYNAKTKVQTDGGRIETEDLSQASAIREICQRHELSGQKLTVEDPRLLEKLEDLQLIAYHRIRGNVPLPETKNRSSVMRELRHASRPEPPRSKYRKASEREM